jgi:hypothetical protein
MPIHTLKDVKEPKKMEINLDQLMKEIKGYIDDKIKYEILKIKMDMIKEQNDLMRILLGQKSK